MNRRTMLLALGGVVGVGLGLGLAWLIPRGAALSTFPGMPSSYEAKELCSCLYVEGRDAAFCERYVRQSVVPSQGREVDDAERRVTAKALFVTSSAHWVSGRDGCVLD